MLSIRWLAGAVVAFVLAPASWGAGPGEVGTGDRRIREQAVRELPLDELTEDAAERIVRVVENPSVYRRLPESQIDCDPSLYLYLLRHPEVVVNIWDLMGVTKLRVVRAGPYSLDTSDGEGTTSQIELVYGTRDVQLFYGEGVYEGPLTARPIHGSCVMLLKSSYDKEADSNTRITSRLDVFLQMDNSAIDLVAKTVQPLLGRSMDHNFIESLRFVQRLSQTAAQNPVGMQRLARRLESVQPEVRERFAVVASKVAGVDATPIARTSAR